MASAMSVGMVSVGMVSYLLRNLAVTRQNQVWATDITYIPMRRGFVYLVAVLDWFSRRVLTVQYPDHGLLH